MSKEGGGERDIVVDSCVMRLYDKPSDPRLKKFFLWLKDEGVLCVNQKLIVEYYRSQPGRDLIAGLINHLTKKKRYKKIKNSEIKAVAFPRAFTPKSNGEDHWHIKTVVLSRRKKLVSRDDNIVRDVEAYPVVDKVKPQAAKVAHAEFYR